MRGNLKTYKALRCRSWTLIFAFTLFFAAYIGRAQPVILTQPSPQTNITGGTAASFTVVAQSLASLPLRYQWRCNGVNISGATTSSLSFSSVQPTNCGSFSAVVADGVDAVSTVTVPLTFNATVITTNDLFITAANLGTTPVGAVRCSNVNASREPNEPRILDNNPGGKSVWFKWHSPFGGIVTVSTSGSGFDTMLGVYQGQSVTSLTPASAVVNDDDSGGFLTSSVTFNSVNNTNYYFAVDGYYGASGDIVLSWNAPITTNIIPAFLFMPVARSVASFGHSVVFTCQATAGTLLWNFNGQSTGVQGTNFVVSHVDDFSVGTYVATIPVPGGFLTGTTPSRLQANALDDGTTATNSFAYNKFLDSVGSPFSNPGQQGSFTVKSGGDSRSFTVTQTYSTVGAAAEPGEPNICGQIGGAPSWYAYVATTNGSLYVNTDGSSYNTMIGVFVGPGDSFSTLTNIGCGYTTNYTNLGQPRVFIDKVAANQTNFILVDGYNGASGTVHLNIGLGDPLVISAPPQSQLVPATSNAVFSITATGGTPKYYFWKFNGSTISGATNASLTVTNVQAGQTGTYSILVSNCVSTVSSNVTLTLAAAPVITNQPSSQEVVQGTSPVFTCLAGGITPAYQWFFGSTNLAGATNTSLTLTNVQAVQAGSYLCIVTNYIGAVTSAVAVLTIDTPPSILVPPASHTVPTNTTASLTVTATANPAPAYQWLFNGSGVGANSSTLNIPNFQSANQGSYRVVVTNLVGSVTSANAILALDSPLRVQLMPPTNHSIHFQLIGAAGSNYIIQTATNNLTNWSSIATNTVTTGFFDFIGTNTGSNQFQLYRLKTP